MMPLSRLSPQVSAEGHRSVAGLVRQLEWSYEVFKELDELQVGLSNRKALLWNGERLLLGGTQGVVEISTEDSSAAAIPPMLITEVFADNLPEPILIIKDGISSARTVVFAAGTKSVRFNFELASNTLRNGISNAYRIKELGEGEKEFLVGLS